MQRLFAVALVFAIAISLPAILGPEPAGAEPSAEPEFTIEAFPHSSGPVTFRDTWGVRRPGGRRHQGTDILSPRGTPIVAVADGFVTFVGEQRLSGYCVKIDHGGGWATSYLHLNNDTPGTDDGEGGEDGAFAAGLAVGHHVKAGQLIGWVGDSGNAENTTPHTHFELIHDDEKLNPHPYLETAWRRTERMLGAAITPLIR